jgi:SAM-dependent methyltransferase
MAATKVELLQMDVTQLSFPDRSFDAVVATFLFCTLPDELQVAGMRELGRVVKPGGIIRCLEYTRPSGGLRRATLIGEQAGFQDTLAGFGIRYALRSSVLAARSIIEGLDYTALWRRELLPLLKVSVANRFIFNTVGDRGSRFFLAHGLERGDARRVLKRLYGASSWTRLFFPIAYWRYRAPLKDQSCDHHQCSCVWCRCAAEESVAAGL